MEKRQQTASASVEAGNTPVLLTTTLTPTNLGACNTTSCIYENGRPTPIVLSTFTQETILSSGLEPNLIVVVTVLPSSSSAASSASPSAASTSPTIESPAADASSIAASTDPSSSTQGPAQSGNAEPNSKTLQGIDSGALAGAAVGCFVAGAVIAALLSFFLFKRRSQRNRHAARSTYISGPEPRHGGEKGTPMVSVAAVAGLDFLPQQADDAEIQRRLSTVTDQIDQHVENFYSNRSIPLDMTLEAELSRFETSQLASPLAACFEHSINPTALIKHCLAFHIFNLTLAPGEGTQPLLPPDIAGTISVVYAKSLSPSTSKDTLAAFSSWKALTRYLRPDLTRDQTTSRSTAEDTTRIASQFTKVFLPWSSAQYSDEHRNRHLTELINHSIQTAIWLFGQPDTFKFDWTTPGQDAKQSTIGRNANSVVIVPAVFKLTHNGTRLGGSGQSVLSPVVKRF